MGLDWLNAGFDWGLNMCLNWLNVGLDWSLHVGGRLNWVRDGDGLWSFLDVCLD
jgi:hypothetical protein